MSKREQYLLKKRQYYYAHKIEMAAYHKKWAQANRDKRRASALRYFRSHKEEVNRRNKEYRRRCPEINKAAVRKWRAKNIERHRLMIADWAKRNVELRNLHSLKRRALKAGTVAQVSQQEWRDLKKACGYRCAYCDRRVTPLTMDHVVPLSRGGAHHISNIVPACGTCNSSKGTKLLQEWMVLC